MVNQPHTSIFAWVDYGVVDVSTIWNSKGQELWFELFLCECPYPITLSLLVDIERVREKYCFGTISEHWLQVVNFSSVRFENWVRKFAFFPPYEMHIQRIFFQVYLNFLNNLLLLWPSIFHFLKLCVKLLGQIRLLGYLRLDSGRPRIYLNFHFFLRR